MEELINLFLMFIAEAFGFREKISTKLNHILQLLIDTTTQSKTQQLKPLNTNESKGDKLITLNPNHIQMFYMNINGLELGKGGDSMLQLHLTYKEKRVDIVCITETSVHWERTHVYHHFR